MRSRFLTYIHLGKEDGGSQRIVRPRDELSHLAPRVRRIALMRADVYLFRGKEALKRVAEAVATNCCSSSSSPFVPDCI